MSDLDLEYTTLTKAQTIYPLKFVLCSEYESDTTDAAVVSFNHVVETVTDVIYPCGTIIDYYQPSVTTSAELPYEWSLCDGSEYDTDAYSDLYSILGTNKLPDLMGRCTVMKDFPNGLNFPLENAENIREQIGSDGVSLSAEHLPPHKHGFEDEYQTGIDGPERRDVGRVLEKNTIIKKSKQTSPFPPSPTSTSFSTKQPSIEVLKIIKLK